MKLWALELDPPLGLWEGWDDVRRIYPAGELYRASLSKSRLKCIFVIVGASAKSDEDTCDPQRIQDLQVALLRLPKVHLLVLEALFGHLKAFVMFRYGTFRD